MLAACGTTDRVRVSERTTIAGTDQAQAYSAATSEAGSTRTTASRLLVPANFEAAQALRARDRWYRAAWFARVAENAETARREAVYRAQQPAQVASGNDGAPAVSAPSTSSHGPHSDAWWHGVATCEQGGRNDPYFGYFSYMDGSAGGKTWAEQVAMGNATIARYGEDMNNGGAWAHACVMAGYAASPGG